MDIKLNKAAPLRITEERHSAINKYLVAIDKTTAFSTFGEFFDYVLKQVNAPVCAEFPNAVLENNPAYEATPEIQQQLEQLITDNAQLAAELKEEKNLHKQAVQRVMEMFHNPFAHLSQKDFADTKEWDQKILTPSLRSLTDTPYLLLTGMQKFLLMRNYCAADPIGNISTIIPGLNDEQLAALEDLRFPRAEDLQVIYNQFAETVNDIHIKVKAADEQGVPLASALEPFELEILAAIEAAQNQPAHDATELATEEKAAEQGRVISIDRTEGPE